jgi:hypothetical protein
MGVQAPVDCKHVGWIVVDLKKNSSTLDEMTRGWTARVQSNPPRKRVCDALRSGSGDDPPGMDESAKGYVRRGQSLAVRDDQRNNAAYRASRQQGLLRLLLRSKAGTRVAARAPITSDLTKTAL